MPELERTLARLGEELDWPRTPDLAASVTARLRAAEEATSAGAPPAPAREPTHPALARRPSLRPRFVLPARPASLRRSLALALVALLVLAGAVLAAVPGARDAVLELFGLQGATVEQRRTLPTPPADRPLDLGRRTTLAGARDRLAFAPLLPAGLGPPDGVYVREAVPGGELLLAYEPSRELPRARSTRLGLLVTEFRGDLVPAYVGKIAGLRSTVERLRVDGRRAIWLEGAPHLFFYRAPGGRFVESRLRLAQNVLLMERGPLLVRLEGAFELERAIWIARSLR
ncbi:MAG: hypothetical protein ACRDL0_02945 [Thermoleophilaceae bacterium]